MKIDHSKLSLKWVSSTTEGRHFLWDMLSFCGVYQDLAGDPHEVARNLGKRAVGLHLLGLLGEVDDELIFNMMREAKNRQLEQEIENDNADTDTRTSIDIDRDILGTINSGGDSSSGDSDDFGYISRHDSGGADI